MKKKNEVEKTAKRLGVRPQALIRAWVLHASRGATEFIPWGIEPSRGAYRGKPSYDLRVKVKDEAEWLRYARNHVACSARQVAELAFRMPFGYVPDVLREFWDDVPVPADCWDTRREGDGWAHHTVRQKCREFRDELATKGGWVIWSLTEWAYDSDTIAAVIGRRGPRRAGGLRQRGCVRVGDRKGVQPEGGADAP